MGGNEIVVVKRLAQRSRETSAGRLPVIREGLGLTVAEFRARLGARRSQLLDTPERELGNRLWDEWRDGLSVPGPDWVDALVELCEEDGWEAVVYPVQSDLTGAPTVYTLEQLIFDVANPTIPDLVWIFLFTLIIQKKRPAHQELTIYAVAAMANSDTWGTIAQMLAQTLSLGEVTAGMLTPRFRERISAMMPETQATGGLTEHFIRCRIEEITESCGHDCFSPHTKRGRKSRNHKPEVYVN